MKDRVLQGQGVKWSGDGCEVFDVASVVPGETQKGANFRDVLGWADFSDGSWQRGVREEAFFGDSMPEVADLSCREGTPISTELEFCVSETLEDLEEAGEVLSL